ncbi:MAG: MATE family efflux transporter [Clostridia bacterium]|nr:MATE family efflux transporter [Clostridia bacterium]
MEEEIIKRGPKDAGIPENRMGTMPIGKLMLSMSWPAMISMFIQALYNIVDSMFVAKVSESALTAVTLVFPIQMLMVAVSIGTAIGVNSLIARRLGARRFEEANLAADHGFRIAFFNWLLFLVFGIFFAGIYINAYSDTPFVIENGTAYLRIVTIGSLFIFVQVVIEKILQATGNMIFPMLSSLAGAVVNVVFDALLIFGLLGFPRLGVAGAALATVIGQIVSLCIGIYLMFGKKHVVSIHLKKFKFRKETLRDIYEVALPAMLMQAIGSVMLFFINGLLAVVSETAVAVVGAYFRLNSFIFMPVFGLNQGVMPIMGYNYGARDKKRLMRTYYLSMTVAAVILVVGTAVFMLIPEYLLALFNAQGDMITIGVKALRVISISFVPAAFGIMSSTFFQSTGHGALSLWQSLIRQLVGIVPLAWILIRTGGVMAVWWAWPLAEILGVLYCLVFIKRLYDKDIRPMGE